MDEAGNIVERTRVPGRQLYGLARVSWTPNKKRPFRALTGVG